MSGVELLLGLMVLFYVGGILVGGRTIRGFGLPSGVEYLLLGFVLGPYVLGVIRAPVLELFSPLLVVGCAWIALVAGVGYTQVGLRRIRVGRSLFGVFLALAVGAGVAGMVFLALRFVPGIQLSLSQRWLLAGSIGAVSSETTRHAVRWVVERHGARGPLSDMLADHARASVLAPALALSVLFAAAPGPGLNTLSLIERAALPPALGMLLGLVATVLLGREFRRDESWGILLGISLLGMGIAARLGQSAVATAFFLGLTIAIASPHRAELKTMVTVTEKPAMLPLAVLAGALVQPTAPLLPLLLSAGILSRLLFELVRGQLVAAFVRVARPAGAPLGLGMMSAGAFTLAAAIALTLRLPTELGPSVLGFAAGALLVGELIGPLMLRRALTRSGEIVPGEMYTPPPPSVNPAPPELPEAR